VCVEAGTERPPMQREKLWFGADDEDFRRVEVGECLHPVDYSL